MDYVYGSVPEVPVPIVRAITQTAQDRADAEKAGTAAPEAVVPVSWEDGGQAWMQPDERPRDPGMVEVLREVQQGSTVVLVGYGYSGAGKTTTLIGDSSAGLD